jgi:hypothetical protein
MFHLLISRTNKIISQWLLTVTLLLSVVSFSGNVCETSIYQREQAYTEVRLLFSNKKSRFAFKNSLRDSRFKLDNSRDKYKATCQQEERRVGIKLACSLKTLELFDSRNYILVSGHEPRSGEIS